METGPHVLVVDDDRDIRELLSRFLVKNGYRVTVATDGRDMRQALNDWAIDMIVLDLMLPGEDGLSLCRDLRSRSSVPVIMLTARGEDIDRIVGLEMGADDYLAKPFNPRELLARIKAVMRRTETVGGGLAGGGAAGGRAAGDRGEGDVHVLAFAGWRLDVDRRALTSPDGVLTPLSAGEYGLLMAFATHPQRVLSREQLLDLARGREAQAFDRSVDVQVSRLRRKIEPDPGEPTLIKTVRGGGYLFTPAVESA